MSSQFEQPETRLLALSLAFASGWIDVFCHFQFQALVATQTGNFILMAGNLVQGDWREFMMKCLSILFFTIGFLLGIFIKSKANPHNWYVWTMSPLILSCFLLPLLPEYSGLWLAMMAAGTGLIMLTFNGSKIENQPYTVMMTSGNYRKMLNSWYDFFISGSPRAETKRIALNYTYLVIAFGCGAILSAYLYQVLVVKTIWLVGSLLLLSLGIYYYQEHRKQA